MLSEHARSKRGDLVLEIDDKLLEAIDQAHRRLVKEEGRGLESAALPSKKEEPREGTPGTRLSPREIQHRLRLGETVAGLAKASGTDEEWIDRFAAPVLAEQARVVERATNMVYKKPRVGPSAVALGQSVAANVFDRGATLSMDEIDEGWGAHMRPEGVWCVTFSFSHKGRRYLAEWDVDASTAQLTARSKLAGDLGYRESGRPMRAPEPAPAPGAGARPAPVKKTVVKRPASKAPGKAAGGKAGASWPVPQTLPGTSTETAPPASTTSSAPAPPAPTTSSSPPAPASPPPPKASSPPPSAAPAPAGAPSGRT
ncbi:MAG: septation protein SepH, partial [Acidimicrobiia bacterium]